MPSPFDDLLPRYDAVVIGAGLGGMTAANNLAKFGRKVLLVEHHYQLGGLATFFKRAGGHIFDISLHGFPHGMIKSTRRYWSKEISDKIHQLKDVRFINPDFDVRTTFDRVDFTRIMIEQFKISAETVEAFFAHLREMNYYDNDPRTTRELFEQFFPGRPDVQRLLLEPIAYANGSTLDDPAITFGIVFSNFMSKGVFIFQGGTDTMINIMTAEMKANGVDIRRNVLVEKVVVEKDSAGVRRVVGVKLRGTRLGEEAEVACATVISNANIKDTVLKLSDASSFDADFLAQAKAVRVNTSSCQVYMGIREGESIPMIGDLVFTSEAKPFSSHELTDFHTTSRTYSVYYPDTRPHTKTPRYGVVTSINQRWEDWAGLSEADYLTHKNRVIEESLVGLEKFIPDIRQKVNHLEAATPRTVNRYVRHIGGTSFGTKFEGLKVSMGLPEQVAGLYHAGSVGIIMSGWLGTINYGVIVSAKADSYLRDPLAKPLGEAEASAGV
ncbi:MAG: phytoene dehydrogenase [Opitutia bacterium]|nr:NAD(P)/FAD-dependent oxidoreductase [Opitutales bacterium]PHX69244.1 MAG: phytoene dehydrogenase [Opitutae bacterium]